MRNKWGNQQQEHHAPIEQVGEHVEIVVVEHENDSSQSERTADPN